MPEIATTSKRLTDSDHGLNDNSSKKAKKSSISDETIEQAWTHYRNFLESENETEDEETADIDELHEIIDILNDCPCIQDDNTPNCLLSTPFGSVRSLLPVLLSMAHLHIGNDLISQGFTNQENDQEETKSIPIIHLERSLKYFPFNASALSCLANYKRMNLKDSQRNICDTYENASVNARQLREMAISILNKEEDQSSDENNVYKEWIELLFLSGMSGVEYIGEEEDENEEEEEEEEESGTRKDISEKPIEDEEQIESIEYSTSDVESVSSFMAALLHSTLGEHDKALKHLTKFNFSHRIHPKVWAFSKGNLSDSLQLQHTTKENLLLAFEPTVFRGNFLPQHLYNRMCNIFAPGSAYWRESNYQDRGYYSFFNDINNKNLSNPTNLIEDVVINHLLPRVKDEMSSDANKIVGFEWWTHTRPLSANLGHQLHFDTDEAFLDNEKKITHPVISSVLYLTGNKESNCQTAGSTIVFNQTPESTEVASKAYVSHALDNSYMVFPGDCLHGVLPCPGKEKLNKNDAVDRLTFMVGFWTRRVPEKMKDQQLYSPCGPLPPASDVHSWVKEIKADYVDVRRSGAKTSSEGSSTTIARSILPSIAPAWECIENDVDGNNKEPKKEQSLPVPCSLDHRFFVHDAPRCFRDSLFKDESSF